jgi:3-oxoacyl-[acyl-carrier protein] reductase
MDFRGKTALVTGASRGIGRAIAHALALQGMHRILLIARNVERLADVAAEVRQLGAEPIMLPVDLTDPIRVNVVIARAWREYGPIAPRGS